MARTTRDAPINKVWKNFLDTFFVCRYVDNKKVDVKTALAYCLRPLKKMAEEEDWGDDDIILVNYFVHTFHELSNAQKKDNNGRYIIAYDNSIYFNTGLITSNMESIYATFERNRNSASRGTDAHPQYFINHNPNNFMRDVYMIDHCNPLPDRCRYFNDYTQLIMDGTKTPLVNWNHIINENWARIEGVLFSKKNNVSEEPMDKKKDNAQILLEGALRRALNRVQANYRTAVPHSFQGELQLLLPLCIKEANVPDLVLTISRRDAKPPRPGEFSYVAKTILTRDMAYMNARLVARPERDWLIAPQNVNEMDDEPDENVLDETGNQN